MRMSDKYGQETWGNIPAPVEEGWSSVDPAGMVELEFGRRVLGVLRDASRLGKALEASVANAGESSKLDAARVVVTFGAILGVAVDLGLMREVDPFRGPSRG
jgi:hypothetical protein